MPIETTIYIHKTIFDKINHASSKTGMSRNHIITSLLKRSMLGNYKLLKLNTPVKYQSKDPLKEWHTFHVRYTEDVYEFCQDMRKFYKMSVSRILAYSVECYLDTIIRDLTRNDGLKCTDNYLFSGYIFIQEHLDRAILWKITWGIPENIEKFFSFNQGS
jgi:hypothetical protein